MYFAEVGGSATYSHLLKNTITTFFRTFRFVFLISFVIFLKFTFLASDISIVGHGISAEINAFSQSLFSRPKHRLKIFLRYSAWVRERMNSGAPQDFIGVDITDTCYERLVHEYLLYLSPRLFL